MGRFLMSQAKPDALPKETILPFSSHEVSGFCPNNHKRRTSANCCSNSNSRRSGLAAGMKPATKRICLSLLSSLTLTAGYHVTAQTKPSVARDLDAIPLSLDARAEASLSITRGILKVEGLRDPVDVLRDRWGVAHIYACNQHDLFFAQGYVAAQDRLFQMELWKRAGQGRLAEIWGPGALQTDVNARLLS